MPQPTPGDVHVDAILTNISVAYLQSQNNFVAQQVFPVVPVDKQSDKYFVFDKDAWFRDEAQKRAPGTESAGSGYKLSTDSYFADVWALHKDIDDQTRANTDNPLDADRNATQFVTGRMLLRQEIQWATDYFTTGIWDTDVVGGTDFTPWSTYATSDPIGDVDAGRTDILRTTGFEANTLVIGYEVFQALRNHPDIIDRIKHTSAENVTPQLIARLMELDRVLVCRAVQNTASEGATGSYGFIQGKHALLCYSAPSPALEQPSAGYTFGWTGVSDGFGSNIGVSRFQMQHLRADRIEVQAAWDNKVIASDMGYFFSGASA